MWRRTLVWTVILSCIIGVSPTFAADAPHPIDPWWMLLHERAVPDDLAFTPAQRQAWHAALAPLDRQFFVLRSKSSQEVATGMDKILPAARAVVAKTLQPSQVQRLEKLLARMLGAQCLLRPDFAQKLNLTATQQADVKAALDEAQAAAAKAREAKDKPAEALQKEITAIQAEQNKRLQTILKLDQQQKWRDLVAVDFDVARFGHPSFQPPELIGDKTAWHNGPPQSLEQLRGQVVVLHFFAFGCINCVHNYPVYREWQQELAGKGVTLIGIHTPETAAERSVDNLVRKLKDDDLRFPILVDNELANWQAWGNTMWPTVYVLDKRGQLRYFWPGELKWQGATGDQIARGWIEELLSEK